MSHLVSGTAQIRATISIRPLGISILCPHNLLISNGNSSFSAHGMVKADVLLSVELKLTTKH
jgi:hypothetical protein